MITYNDLYEYLRKERYSEQLQPLPKNFIEDIIAYFEEKKAIAGKSEDVFSDAIIKTKKQFENAISIFKELMLRRRKKLLNLAFIAAETGISKRDFENMLDFEKVVFDKIVLGIEEAEKSVTGFLNGSQKSKEIKNKIVVFKQDTAEFLGVGGEKLGPYSKGDVASLPVDIAKILVESENIEFVDEE
jgi:DNA replication initiation complex subunit (GINS family)